MEGKVNARIRGAGMTVLGGICWGFSGACGQYLFGHYTIDPAWLTSVRMLYAGTVLMIYAFFTNRQNMLRILQNRRDFLQLLAFSWAGLLFCQYTYLSAVSWSNAGTATVLQYLVPIFLMLLICLSSRRWPRGIEVLCVLLALSGTFFLATHGNPHTMVITPEALFWGILSAVAGVFYSLLPCRLMQKYGSLPITTYGLFFGGVLLCFFESPWKMPAGFDGTGAMALAGMVVVGTILAFVLFLQGVKDVGPLMASMLGSSEPLSATFFTVFWLGTTWVPMDLVGMGCILLTVFILSVDEIKRAA